MGKKKEVDDRFKKFGTVSFTSISKVNEFIHHMENGKVSGTRCNSCDISFFPPRADCCQCFSSDMEWFDIQGAGRLITFSTLKFGPAGFEEEIPYSTAVLDYGNFRIFGRISKEIPETDIEIGMELKPAVITLSSGQLTYEFQKA